MAFSFCGQMVLVRVFALVSGARLVCSTQGTGCYIYTRPIETRRGINKLSVAHRTASNLGHDWFFDFEGTVPTPKKGVKP